MKVRRAALTCGLSNGVGFFGLGMALYFASQGAAFMAAVDWISPRRGYDRCWLAFPLTASLNWLFAALAFGLIVYVVALTTAITSGAWFSREQTITAHASHNDESTWNDLNTH